MTNQDEMAMYEGIFNPEDIKSGYILQNLMNVRSELIMVAEGKDAKATESIKSSYEKVLSNQEATWSTYLPDQYEGIKMGGTLRLGLYDCYVKEGTKAYEAYQSVNVKERHRHRYEFNNQYKTILENAGLEFSGINPQTGLVEIIEIPDHRWFVAGQFHPEFLSRPQKPQPLFREFIKATISKGLE